MTTIAYTYAGYVDVDGAKVLKTPYLSRHIFPSEDLQVAPPGCRLVTFSTDAPGSRYEVGPVERTKPADEHSPRIIEGQFYYVGTGERISVWEPVTTASAGDETKAYLDPVSVKLFQDAAEKEYKASKKGGPK